MRAEPVKFLFDHDFAATGEGKPSIKPDEHAVKLKEAEAAGFAGGFAQGQAESTAEAGRHAAAALQRIAAALEKLDPHLAAVKTKLEPGGGAVAVAAAGKPAPALIAREPFAE